MNTAGYPAKVFPLHGRSDGLPGQPGGPAVAQSTTVNVITEPPKDHIIWFLCNFLHSNLFCLGLAALIFSIKARDRKVAGDLEGARHYGSTARCLNIWATVLASITALIVIIIITILTVQEEPVYRNYSVHNTFKYDYRG